MTGAGGSVARSLIAELVEAGNQVLAVVRPGGSAPPDVGDTAGLTVVECDLGDTSAANSLVLDHRPGAIINLAVERTNDLDHDRQVNSNAVDALVRAAGSIDAHLIHTGSSLEYGSHDQPMGPDTPHRPASVLGITKLEATRIVTAAIDEGRLRGCVLRLFHVYGLGEPSHRLIPTVFRAAIDGSTVPLTSPGFGHDLVHVGDVTATIGECLRRGVNTSRVIDVCTGETTLNETIIDVIEAAMSRRIDCRIGAFEARDWDRTVWTGDPSRFVELLGRRPLSFSEGISSMIRTSAWEIR